VARLERERLPQQRLGLHQPLCVSVRVVAIEGLEHERRGDAGERVDIVGLHRQRLLVELAYADHVRRRGGPVRDCPGAHDQIGGIGAVRPFALAAAGFGVDDVETDGARQASDDLVLDLKQAGALDVEPFGPQRNAGPRVDQLGVDANPFAIRHHAAGKRIAHVELAADAPHHRRHGPCR